jgi:decaprenyl-phosphate phosphoribosyltransferase
MTVASEPGHRMPPLLRATRPRQWVKNLLVFAAPGAAGVVFRAGPFLRCLGALGVFVMASAATYLANDVADRNADRLHPHKRMRPIAAGLVSPRTAMRLCVALAVAALAGAAALRPMFAVVIASYIAITFAYSAWL